MKRLLFLISLIGTFIYAWNWFDVITIRVVGQQSTTGPIQSKLEKPFFESLPEKTGLPIKTEYRTVDSLGFKDNRQLSMIKGGMFDMVSLRFLQNGQEEVSILGADLPGINSDFSTARKTGDAFSPFIDESLQKNFDVKLLGLWTFGPQIIFCSKPIAQLSDLKGLRVRVGASTYNEFIKSQGGIPVIIPFEQVADALALKMTDCAITSQTSAYSAKWIPYMTHAYPVVTQMGTNGIAMRLNTWNRLNKKQQEKLMEAVQAYSKAEWLYAEQLNLQARACIEGNNTCELSEKYKVVYSPVSKNDKDYMLNFGLTHSFPEWANRCDKVHPDCSARWQVAVKPILNQ